MPRIPVARIACVMSAAMALSIAFSSRGHAQAHYFNLDAGRPGRIEDAIATERYELEAQFAPFRIERLIDGTMRWRAEPKLSFGAAPFTELEVRAPIVYTETRGSVAATGGLAGLGVGVLRTLNLERSVLPAFALAGEALLPAGTLASSQTTYSLKALATKTTPIGRLHLNAAYGSWSIGATASAPIDSACTVNCEPPPIIPDTPCDRLPWRESDVQRVNRLCNGTATVSLARAAAAGGAGLNGNRWMAGGAFDRAFPLISTLVSVDVFAERFQGLYVRTDWTAEVGIRHQWTPRLTTDLGVARRFVGIVPSTSFGVGATYSFPIRPVSGSGRTRLPLSDAHPQTYLSAPHNWRFRKRYPDIDRLFNAFDYGHAALYQALLVRGPAAAGHLEGPEYDFITKRLLRRPPSLPLEERAIGADYATLVPELVATFEWAHMLHRQIYDILVDDRIWPTERDARVAEVLHYYLSRQDLALSTQPKAMDLMEGQPYSLAFRREAPKFNGLLWSYHWMQMAIYDALLAAPTGEERGANVDATVARFWALLGNAPSSTPGVMPMTPVVAPRFTARYPEAAIIFDNLHALHDVVADILASPVIPATEKRRAILRAAVTYRDSTTSVTSRDVWMSMAKEMGSETMGGSAPVKDPR